HFWGDALKLHQAIEGARFGGVGAGLSPAAALGAGLKVDSTALPPSLVDAVLHGAVDLNDPANTLALLRLNAVIGVVPIGSTASGGLQSVGVTCALCHSTVDDSVAPGIGRRRDGWPNRDLNVGAIIAMAPDLSAVAALLQVDQPTVRAVANSWGPGRFDAEQFLVGARAGMGDVRADDDKVTAKLAPLHFYQLAIPAPAPPPGSFDRRAAARGESVFTSRARCSTCHVAPLFTEPGWAMHT